MTVEQIRQEIAKLTSEERAELFAYYEDPDLNIQLSPDEEAEIAAAWEVELQRRTENMLSGKSKGIPVEEVMARLREKYP